MTDRLWKGKSKYGYIWNILIREVTLNTIRSQRHKLVLVVESLMVQECDTARGLKVVAVNGKWITCLCWQFKQSIHFHPSPSALTKRWLERNPCILTHHAGTNFWLKWKYQLFPTRESIWMDYLKDFSLEKSTNITPMCTYSKMIM